MIENKISKKGKIWSLKVIVFFSIVATPIVGAILASINYIKIGNIKKGLLFFCKIFFLMVALNFLFYFFISEDQSLNSFISACIVAFIIFLDQKKLFNQWKKEYPNEKTRSWFSAFIISIMLILFFTVIIYFIG